VELAAKAEERRQATLAAVREERTRIIAGMAAGGSGPKSSGAPAGGRTASLSRGSGHVDSLRSASIERERRRNERAKAQQEDDLRTMIANEERMAKLAEENAAKEAEARAKDAKRQRDRERSMRKAAEERRLAELKRKEEADERTAAMRKEAAAAFREEAEARKKADAEYRAMLAARKREEEEHRIAQAEEDARKEVRGGKGGRGAGGGLRVRLHDPLPPSPRLPCVTAGGDGGAGC
jgi:hypothetical protein